jgi:hypothetical protein
MGHSILKSETILQVFHIANALLRNITKVFLVSLQFERKFKDL